MTFTPLEYAIPGYVVEGLTVLGGKPKLGKSWWAYDASIAVATGGRTVGAVECEQGDVLYLALEDNQRRVQSRLETLCPTRKLLGQNLNRLTIRTIAGAQRRRAIADDCRRSFLAARRFSRSGAPFA